MKYFFPISPDRFLKKRKGDGALARFGHLNAIVDKLNEFDAHQAITALVGGGQSGATQLDLGFNLVTTATSGDSVILPSLEAYCACTGGCGPIGPVIVKNEGPGSLTIYPFLGEDIDGGAVNVPITLDPGSSVSFTDMDCNSWESYANSTDPAFTGVNSVSGCNVDNTDPANPVITAPFVGAGLSGDGCTALTPLVADIQSIEDCSGNTLTPVLGVVTIPGPTIEPISATEALTGDGCLTPLSVCIDGTTITKDLNGCLQVANPFVPVAAACPYVNTNTANYPGIPLARAATFELLSGTAMTIGLAAQNVTGDIGYAGAITGTPNVISGNEYSSTLGTVNEIAYNTDALADAAAIYVTLSALAGAAMPAILTGGATPETITPGVYTQAGAMTTVADANIILNGAGCYVFISTGGDLALGAGTRITLQNGAKASDIYWVTAGGMSASGADAIWKGTVLSPGAITSGAHFTIEGRLISTAGAISLGAGNANGIGAYFLPLP